VATPQLENEDEHEFVDDMRSSGRRPRRHADTPFRGFGTNFLQILCKPREIKTSTNDACALEDTHDPASLYQLLE
jgi:hypothetical protein